jgi:hypothetical protein
MHHVLPVAFIVTHLLLCIRAGAWPFGNDIFLGLVVRREGKCNTGEGSSKIDTNNELSLATALPFDLGSRVSTLELLRNRATRRRRRTWRIALGASKTGRAASLGTAHGRRTTSHRVHVWRRIADGSTGVDRGRPSSHLARRRTVLLIRCMRTGATNWSTRRSARIVGSVAGRSVAGARVIHGQACRRRRSAEGRRGRVSRKRECLLGGMLRYLAERRGLLAGRLGLGVLDAGGRSAFSEAQAFEAGIHRVHMEEEGRKAEERSGKRGRGEVRGAERGRIAGRGVRWPRARASGNTATAALTE